MDSSDNSGTLAPPTLLVTTGRDTKAQKGFINPPVVHGSTVLYPTARDFHAHRGEYQYGRHGTPTTRALQDTLMALEGPQCAGVGLAPSGLVAISTALLAVLRTGDHLLVTDSVYRPTRIFCNGLLARYGVETSYFDPPIGRGIERLFKQNTRAVLVEAPGSQSFEMPDIPAIAAADLMLNTVKLFGMGFSGGGFESLIIPFDCSSYRTATTWNPGGPTLRLHIGLENVDDLKADLDRGFAALSAH